PASPGNHPSDGPKTGDALTFKMDHSSGADHGDLLLDRAIALVLKVMSLAAQEPYAGACDRQGDNRDDEFKEGQYSPQKSLQREHSRLSNRRHH
ncbi:hypothetical protein, partial [Mesorhizobium sp. J18]|uniref:hypothetical protein n=1 Tax=Mesorhizobium sp. J18 TaxID=935263 RepID=UPI001AEEB482